MTVTVTATVGAQFAAAGRSVDVNDPLAGIALPPARDTVPTGMFSRRSLGDPQTATLATHPVAMQTAIRCVAYVESAQALPCYLTL